MNRIKSNSNIKTDFKANCDECRVNFVGLQGKFRQNFGWIFIFNIIYLFYLTLLSSCCAATFIFTSFGFCVLFSFHSSIPVFSSRLLHNLFTALESPARCQQPQSRIPCIQHCALTVQHHCPVRLA